MDLLFLYLYIIILITGLAFLLLNFNFLSVTHAKASEYLPVEKFAIYSSLEISILYILVILILVNVSFVKISRISILKPYIFSLTPLIGIISIILLIFNPHTLLLNPSGWPPTRLESIELAGIVSIILFSLVIIISVCQLYFEGYMKNYFIKLLLILGALLLSDFIHEGGHAIMVLISGGNIEEFYPFPVLLGTEFNAGFVGFSNVPSNLVPLVLLGGEIFQWITICIILILVHFKPKFRNNLFIITIMVIAFLDFPLYVINNSIGLPHWFLIGSTNGDIIIISKLINIPLWIFIIIALCQLTVMFLIFYFLIYRNKKDIITNSFEIESLNQE